MAAMILNNGNEDYMKAIAVTMAAMILTMAAMILTMAAMIMRMAAMIMTMVTNPECYLNATYMLL